MKSAKNTKGKWKTHVGSNADLYGNYAKVIGSNNTIHNGNVIKLIGSNNDVDGWIKHQVGSNNTQRLSPNPPPPIEEPSSSEDELGSSGDESNFSSDGFNFIGGDISSDNVFIGGPQSCSGNKFGRIKESDLRPPPTPGHGIIRLRPGGGCSMTGISMINGKCTKPFDVYGRNGRKFGPEKAQRAFNQIYQVRGGGCSICTSNVDVSDEEGPEEPSPPKKQKLEEKDDVDLQEAIRRSLKDRPKSPEPGAGKEDPKKRDLSPQPGNEPKKEAPPTIIKQTISDGVASQVISNLTSEGDIVITNSSE